MKLPVLEGSIFLSLAPELIESISDELELSDITQLRLTCKVMAELLNARIFRTLTIKICKQNAEEGIQKVESLATAAHAACRAARVLTIMSLSAEYDPRYRNFRFAKGRLADTPSETSSDVVIVEKRLVSHLFGAIASLKGVHSVKWAPNKFDNELIHRIVLDALKTLPSLRRVRINFSNFMIPMELDALKSLEEIAISTEKTSEPYQEEIYDNLAKTIALNPTLTSIDVTGIHHYGKVQANKTQSLHQLFKYYPATAPPLSLRILRLKSFLLRLDNITISHLAHLTSLSLTDIDDPLDTDFRYNHRFGNDDFEYDQAHPELIQERKSYGSTPEDIWNALRVARVQLETITADNIPYSFLHYLSSYSGLRELHLRSGGFLNGTSSDAMALRFHHALANHAQSLESLQIFANYEGLWCFGWHNVETISKFCRLKYLGLSIRSSDLRGNKKDQNGNSSEPDVIGVLIDMATSCIPNLEIVHISSARLEAHRGNSCGPGDFFEIVHKRMLESADNYAAPPSCQRIPALKIDSLRKTLFIGERNLPDVTYTSDREDGEVQVPGMLRYVERKSPKSESCWWPFNL